MVSKTNNNERHSNTYFKQNSPTMPMLAQNPHFSRALPTLPRTKLRYLGETNHQALECPKKRCDKKKRSVRRSFFISVVIFSNMRTIQKYPTIINHKQGHVLVFNLVSCVSSTAFRPANYRSLCHPGKIRRRGAFRFHSFQFAQVLLQVGGDW